MNPSEAPLLAGLPPVHGADARLLVLGSLPGAASLAAGRYYAHPRNQFWQLIGHVLGRDLVAMAYEVRLDCLRQSGVALWDVVAEGRRKGSLDAALRMERGSDLAGLIARLPGLRLVAFNGATAARLAPPLDPAVDRIVLPSSSPAHTLPLADKQAAWNALRRAWTGTAGFASPAGPGRV